VNPPARRFQPGEIRDEPVRRLCRAEHCYFDPERMTVESAVLVPARHAREAMRGVESELVTDLE
jgi:hypothetical protein